MAEPAQKKAKLERKFLFSSESVNEGHPDKLCGQASDAVLDTCLRGDPKSKVAAHKASPSPSKAKAICLLAFTRAARAAEVKVTVEAAADQYADQHDNGYSLRHLILAMTIAAILAAALAWLASWTYLRRNNDIRALQEPVPPPAAPAAGNVPPPALPDAQQDAQRPRRRGARGAGDVLVTRSGECYHCDATCRGLRGAVDDALECRAVASQIRFISPWLAILPVQRILRKTHLAAFWTR